MSTFLHLTAYRRGRCQRSREPEKRQNGSPRGRSQHALFAAGWRPRGSAIAPSDAQRHICRRAESRAASTVRQTSPVCNITKTFRSTAWVEVEILRAEHGNLGETMVNVVGHDDRSWPELESGYVCDIEIWILDKKNELESWPSPSTQWSWFTMGQVRMKIRGRSAFYCSGCNLADRGFRNKLQTSAHDFRPRSCDSWGLNFWIISRGRSLVPQWWV